MNRQPFQTPPKHWTPKLNPWWVRLCRPLRLRVLRRQQKMKRIDIHGLDHVAQLLEDGVGVLITPNHSFHYDSYVLFEAAHQLNRPFHFMTAWQVFAMSSYWERWWLQKHGCFSIDRESNDMQAFRQAVALLQKSPFPLVIFPEGEIYHTNDRVTPFREGAAAIALTAARKADRPIACVPCGLKCWYMRDPTPDLLRLMDRLEQRLMWRPRPDLPLSKRLYRLFEGLLSLKELEYLGHAQTGAVGERRDHLADVILKRQEQHYHVKAGDHTIPERVRELRRALIGRLEKTDLDPNEQIRVQSDMEDLFFVIQLFSYPSNYVREQLSIERVAETLDKLEEDLLRKEIPSVRGTRRVVVRFGEPLVLPRERQKRDAVADLTSTLQQRVQHILDGLNAEYPSPALPGPM